MSAKSQVTNFSVTKTLNNLTITRFVPTQKGITLKFFAMACAVLYFSATATQAFPHLHRSGSGSSGSGDGSGSSGSGTTTTTGGAGSSGGTSSTADGIKTPLGIFALANNLGGPLFPDATLQSSYVAGLALRGCWANTETTSGDWNFVPMDVNVTLASTNSKAVSLSWAAGNQSPGWVMDSLEGTDVLNLTLPDGTTGPVPMPWSVPYRVALRSFLVAAGKHYDANPNVKYVTMSGMGNGVEPFVVYNETDYATFEAAGGLPRWVRGCERIIDMYAEAFPTTPIILAIAEPIQGCSAEEDAAGNSAMTEVINYGLTTYPGHFGLANHDLQAIYLQPNWRNTEISENSATSPCGFQLVSDAAGDEGDTGNLGTALNNGIGWGADFIEVYPDYFTDANAGVLTNADDTMLAR